MKSTLVKDMSSSLLNLTPAQAGRKAGEGDFRKIWNNQTNKAAPEKQDAPEGKPTVSKAEDDGQLQSQAAAKIQERQTVRGEEPADPEEMSKAELSSAGEISPAEEQPSEELSPEELERVMEVLAATAAELMQKLADAFGISVEELQAAMDEMDLKPMDLLDASTLGNLVIQLGGGQDAYALVTDEALYEKYQTLMGQQQEAVQECARELNMDPKEAVLLVKEEPADETAVEENAADRQIDDEPIAELTRADGDGTEAPVQKVQDGRNTPDHESGQEKGDDPQPGDKAEKGEHPNILIQDIRTGQTQPGIVQTEAQVSNSPWSGQTQDIMNQIMDYMKIQLSPDTTSLEMQLHPANLGTLHVQIESKGGIVTANFITQNESVKAALETQMVQLKESFEEQGVRIEAIEVTVQTHEFERNLEQGRGRNQHEPEKRTRARRINLGDALSMESMDEEDTLTAEMMAMGGNTVDYTA